jgi:hypothetical protein
MSKISPTSLTTHLCIRWMIEELCQTPVKYLGLNVYIYWIRDFRYLPGTMVIKHFSTRYDIENMDSEERRNLYIPELAMTWGQSYSALKKSWHQLKYCLKFGDFERVEILKTRISHIRESMGLENEELY